MERWNWPSTARMRPARAKTISARPRREPTNSQDFRHWHTTWQLISVFDIPANLPLSWGSVLCLLCENQKIKKIKWTVFGEKCVMSAGPKDGKTRVIFCLCGWKNISQLHQRRRDCRHLAEITSGTVKWYNIEIYFYADDADDDGDDDDHFLNRLLAMPTPYCSAGNVVAMSQCQLAKCQSNLNSSSSQWQLSRNSWKNPHELETRRHFGKTGMMCTSW